MNNFDHPINTVESIDSIESSGDGNYVVKVTETFTIYKGDDYDRNTKLFKNSYFVKKVGDKFLITNMKVNESSSTSSAF
jgi:hypothetical protein